MNRKISRSFAGLSLLAALATGAIPAQAEQVWARVIAVTPMTEAGGRTVFHVRYEHGGRQYVTQTDSPPGTSLPIEVGDYGMTTKAVAAQLPLPAAPMDDRRQPPDWNHVVPEPGVVVSSGPAPMPPAYSRPAPLWPAPLWPAPLYYPAPVYVQPAYAYPAPYPPYLYSPLGISLNLGYSRGWGGHRGRWR